jgi:hypothetical protein
MKILKIIKIKQTSIETWIRFSIFEFTVQKRNKKERII